MIPEALLFPKFLLQFYLGVVVFSNSLYLFCFLWVVSFDVSCSHGMMQLSSVYFFFQIKISLGHLNVIIVKIVGARMFQGQGVPVKTHFTAHEGLMDTC